MNQTGAQIPLCQTFGWVKKSRFWASSSAKKVLLTAEKMGPAQSIDENRSWGKTWISLRGRSKRWPKSSGIWGVQRPAVAWPSCNYGVASSGAHACFGKNSRLIPFIEKVHVEPVLILRLSHGTVSSPASGSLELSPSPHHGRWSILLLGS